MRAVYADAWAHPCDQKISGAVPLMAGATPICWLVADVALYLLALGFDRFDLTSNDAPSGR